MHSQAKGQCCGKQRFCIYKDECCRYKYKRRTSVIAYFMSITIQSAGGAGCGHSQTRNARRKINWRVRGRPLINMAAEFSFVVLVANLRKPAWPACACACFLAYTAWYYTRLSLLLKISGKANHKSSTPSITKCSKYCKITSCFRSASFENNNIYH